MVPPAVVPPDNPGIRSRGSRTRRVETLAFCGGCSARARTRRTWRWVSGAAFRQSPDGDIHFAVCVAAAFSVAPVREEAEERSIQSATRRGAFGGELHHLRSPLPVSPADHDSIS